MTRIIAQLTLLLIGVAFLTSIAKAQNDTVPILNTGNSINVTKTYWNGIATEYNRLKLESSLSKAMIKSLTDQINIIQINYIYKDSLFNNSTNIIEMQSTDIAMLSMENYQLREQNQKLLSKSKLTKTWFLIGYSAGLATTTIIKLL
jgi:hypothetical protein